MLWCTSETVSQKFFIEAVWRIYASVNDVNNGSDNGLSPGWRQGIILTDAGILSLRPLGIYVNKT